MNVASESSSSDADGVAVGRLELFEVLHAEVQHGERLARAMARGDAAAELVGKRRAIGHVADLHVGRAGPAAARRRRRFGLAASPGLPRGDDRQALGAVVPVAAVAAGLLRGVDAVVGAAEQLDAVFAGDALGHADARGHAERLAGELHGHALDGPANSLGGHLAFGDLRVRHDDGELLAAVTARQVARFDDPRQRAADAPQHLVAGLMAVHVVELLEVVDVENQHRERPAVVRKLLDVLVEAGVERPAIGQLASARRCELRTAGCESLRPESGSFARRLRAASGSFLLASSILATASRTTAPELPSPSFRAPSWSEMLPTNVLWAPTSDATFCAKSRNCWAAMLVRAASLAAESACRRRRWRRRRFAAFAALA